MSDYPLTDPYHRRPYWGWAIIFGVPLALAFGTVGFWIYDGKPAGFATWLNALYHSAQLFILHMPHLDRPINWYLEFGRWLAAGLFGMMAVVALYHLLIAQARRLRLGFTEDHTVIFGLGQRVIHLARCLADKGKTQAMVLVTPTLKEADISECRTIGAMPVVGNVEDATAMIAARIHSAQRLIAICDDDRTNVQIAVQASKVIHDKAPHGSKPVECYVHIEDVDLRASLHRAKCFPSDSRFRVKFFDLYDSAARRLLMESDQLPIDRGGILENDLREVRLVVLGFGRMGRCVAVRAAQLGHFANHKPLRISVIDRQAKKHEQALLFRYPAFPQTCSISFEQLEVESIQALNLLENWCQDKNSVTSIAVCFDQDSLAMEVALRLLPRLSESKVPIAVRMSRAEGFSSLLKRDTAKGGGDIGHFIRGFGMMGDRCYADVFGDPINEQLAQVIHEHFRCNRMSEGRDPARDRSVLPWAELDDDFRDSNRQQADHIAIKLHGIGCVRTPKSDARPALERFNSEEIEIMAQMEHSRWCAERLLAGWILGPEDIKERKISASLQPWATLSEEVRGYDREDAQLIPQLLAGIGEKVCRKRSLR